MRGGGERGLWGCFPAAAVRINALGHVFVEPVHEFGQDTVGIGEHDVVVVAEHAIAVDPDVETPCCMRETELEDLVDHSVRTEQKLSLRTAPGD